MRTRSSKLDVVVWGSTGFTGRLVCEYLNNNYSDLKWGIAGRNENTLTALKSSLNLPEGVQIIVADLKSESSLEAMALNTHVIISTAGPYAKIGEPIVKAYVFQISC